jgi:o-succinylbenzoate---CoA ligase
MQDLWIKFDKHQFSLTEIKNGVYPDSLPHFGKSSLDFCYEWLNGKETFILQTSGSTGMPKKISVTRNQLKASARLTAEAIGIQKNDTSLICLDTRYIAGIMMIVRSLETGMNMIIVEPSSNPLEKLEEDDTIDFTALVPLQLETILKSPQREKLNKIKNVLIGGAAINPKTIKELEGLICSFFATYGMTETLSHIALQKLNGINAQHFFQVLPGITITQDERGCLVVNAPHISSDLIVTNDLVELPASSQFRWLGRIDTIINTGGVKVIPEKIEAAISVLLDELKISNRIFVAALPDALLGESVNLFVEGSPFPTQTEERIQHKFREALNKFETPKSIRYVSGFINTETGKINKIKTIALIKS